MPILALKKFGPDISWKYKVMAKAADFLLMRRTLFEHLEYRGVRTYLWVLNEPEDFDRGKYVYDLFTSTRDLNLTKYFFSFQATECFGGDDGLPDIT